MRVAAAAVMTMVLLLLLLVGGVSSAFASVPTVVPYGEVQRIGGFDASATYSTTGESQTTGLGSPGQPASFVYPLGMAVDTNDPTAPDHYAIYVLENVNPQALDTEAAQSTHSTDVSLEYRLQKISDAGVVLASTTFTLKSSASEPSLHAVALALDSQADRVYVLIMDVPPVADNTSNSNAVDRIDAWTTGREGTALAPAVGLSTGVDDKLSKDPDTGGGELAGPGVLQGASLLEDIDGASIAVYGLAQTADLALAGNKYTSAAETTPVVELVGTSAGKAGTIEATSWTDTADTEDVSAKDAEQKSEGLYEISSNQDGSLNASFGPIASNTLGSALAANYEPNMATIGAGSLSPTTAFLPSALVAENVAQPRPHTVARHNIDAAATMGFTPDIHQNELTAFQPWGGTEDAGSLAPSVVQLDGGGEFPSEVYAGLVAAPEGAGIDNANPAEMPFSWKVAEGHVEGETRSILTPASLGLRVFDKSGESLTMIGNVTAGGPCNLQSSPTVSGFFGSLTGRPSFVALAPGREGVLFALVQPDLIGSAVSNTLNIEPMASVGASMGDQVVEFAPGAQSAAAGQNASKWQECPQPTGGFSIANKTLGEPPVTGTGEVAVLAGTDVEFNAGEANLRGAAAWAYDWDLEGGVNQSGEGPIFNRPWTVRNTFAATPEEGHAWMWPTPTVEAEFKTPGTYTEKLDLVNDFGALVAQRTLRVIAAGAITDAKVVASGGPTEGTPVLLSASATLPQGDKVKNYHWEFGDGQEDDTGEAPEAEHSYAKAGHYIVTLTVTDLLGQKAEAKETVEVTQASVQEKPAEKPVAKEEARVAKIETPTNKIEAPLSKTPPIVKPKPLTNAQKLAKALKLCKKKPKKQRASCAKQAKKKYAPKPKTKKKSTSKR